MTRLLTIGAIALTLLLYAAAVTDARSATTPDHAITPSPTSRADFCGWYGGNRLIRCYCDVWLRYPLCKRWHWHRQP